MPELDELLTTTLRDGESALRAERLTDDELAVLRGRVSARRARRHVLQGIVGLPVAAGLALAVWAIGGHHAAPAPVVTQTPAPSPTSSAPSPSPTPTPNPTPTATAAALVPLPAEPGLPPRNQAPADVLERTRPGWVLSTYQPRPSVDPPAPAPDTTVLLTSPDAVTYELVRLPGYEGGSLVTYDVLRWDTGSATARFGRAVYGDEQMPATWSVVDVDLRTGTTTDVGLDSAGLSWPSAIGDVIAWRDGATGDLVVDAAQGRYRVGETQGVVVASPDDSRLLVGDRVLDLASGTDVGRVPAEPGAGWCFPVAWWSATEVLETCADAEPGDVDYLSVHTRLVVAPLVGAPPRVLRTLVAGDPLPSPWSVAHVADGVLVVGATALQAGLGGNSDACWDGSALLTADSLRWLPTTDPRDFVNQFLPQTAGGVVVVEVTGGCSGDAVASTLDRVDPSTGTATTLVPLPAGDRDAGGDTWWLSGPESWVIGR